MVEKLKQNLSAIRAMGLLLGPAFVAAIAYVDPGNFATNLSAGSSYGYQLLWVLLAANATASLVQYLSAKLGLVTNQSLPEIVRDQLSQKLRIMYWLQAELAAIATDIAEVLGGAIALQLLFRLPLIVGGIITGCVSMLLLVTKGRRGQATFERITLGCLLIIPIGFIAGLFIRRPDPAAVAHGLIPTLQGQGGVLLAVGILGATVMPHVVYLHSALSRDRHGKAEPEKLKVLIKATRIDVGIAMVVAGGINAVMLLLAASALKGVAAAQTINGAQHAIGIIVGHGVATLFSIGLLASGLAATAVGCYAGSVVMGGLLRRQISLYVRRLITLIPALIIIAAGLNPTRALVLSQVVLSFAIPFALIPLVKATSNKPLMGVHVNAAVTTVLAWLATAAIVLLNIVLIVYSV